MTTLHFSLCRSSTNPKLLFLLEMINSSLCPCEIVIGNHHVMYTVWKSFYCKSKLKCACHHQISKSMLQSYNNCDMAHVLGLSPTGSIWVHTSSLKFSLIEHKISEKKINKMAECNESADYEKSIWLWKHW